MSFRKPPPPISCFPYILVRLHRIFKILVPNPYNTSIIMGGRDKNFEDLMQSDRDIRKTRYGRRRFFSNHSLHLLAPLDWSTICLCLVLLIINTRWKYLASVPNYKSSAQENNNLHKSPRLEIQYGGNQDSMYTGCFIKIDQKYRDHLKYTIQAQYNICFL